MMELIVFVSDFHFGRKTAGWNTKRAQSTLHRIANQISALAAATKANRIHILFLGDIMDGECVYPNQAYELELTGFEQVYDGARLFAEHFIRPIAAVAQVHLDGVPGNHAYLRFAYKKTNLDAFFYATLVQLLREANVRFDSSFFQRGKNDALEIKVATCSQLKFLIGHGHFLRSVVDIPFTSAQRRVLSWLASYTQAGIQFQLAAFANFHRFAFFAISGGKYILFNGCMLAHDEYSLTRYGHHGDRLWAAVVVDGKKLLALHLLTDQTLEKDRLPKMAVPVTEKPDRNTRKQPLQLP